MKRSLVVVVVVVVVVLDKMQVIQWVLNKTTMMIMLTMMMN